MKMFATPYIFHAIWIIMTVAGLQATADYLRAQHEIFDENVIQKWKDYEVFSRGLQGTARVQRARNGKSQESTFRFKQNRKCALAIFPRNDRDPLLLRCSLSNSLYMAIIHLNESDPNDVVLQEYTPLSGDLGSFSTPDLVFFRTSRHLAFSNTKSLRQAVSDPSFNVVKVTKETQNGQGLIQVDYVYDYESRGNHERTNGSLWLDPSRCWCICRSKSSIEVTTGGKRNSEVQADLVCEINDHPSGYPILKSTTDRIKAVQYKINRTMESTTKTDYELEVNDSVPDSEFTLSAFGLPEPVDVEPVKKPIPVYIWILVTAGVCAALALGFRYLARRFRPKPAI